MELPIYIDGVEEGRLTMEKDGAVTVVRAELRDVGRVVRLYLIGEREACLGVPAPENGRLRLERRFTPNDMRAFPRRPEYAAEQRLAKKAGREPVKAPAGQTENKPPDRRVLWQGGRPYYF